MPRLDQGRCSMKKIFAFVTTILLLQQTHAFMGLSEVKAGELYRSGQMNDVELIDAVSRYGIKTLINLRGAHPGEQWWDEENAVAVQYQLNYVNIPMSAKAIPSR